jgi:NADH-quinone oxidoreductase subunit J
MGVSQILFWFLSALAIIAAGGVVLSKNPVYSVLWLIVVFFSISGHYVLMNAQFLAIVNIIVYAGAIMVLFLFVVMQNDLNMPNEPTKNIYLKMAGVIAGMCLMIVFIAALAKSSDVNVTLVQGSNVGLVKPLGKALFSDYVVPFEISSVLFLSAMVGAVVMGKKDIQKTNS